MKTNQHVKLPLFKPVLDIIAKYEGKIPKLPVSGQNFRWNIKAIGKKAKLKKEIHFSYINIKTDKQIPEPVIVPFYEMMKTKTARKTFCTLMLTHYKLDVHTIMAFSGHTTISAFESYIADSADDAVFNKFAGMVAEDKTFG